MPLPRPKPSRLPVVVVVDPDLDTGGLFASLEKHSGVAYDLHGVQTGAALRTMAESADVVVILIGSDPDVGNNPGAAEWNDFLAAAGAVPVLLVGGTETDAETLATIPRIPSGQATPEVIAAFARLALSTPVIDATKKADRDRKPRAADPAQDTIQDLIDQIPAPIQVRGLDGRLWFANKAYAVQEGKTRRELLAADPIPLTEEETQPNYESTRTVTDDAGEPRVVRGIRFPLRTPDGVTLAMANLDVDVTAMYHDLDRLARLGAIVESSSDAIFSLDQDNLVVTWNAAAERLFGYSADELTGRAPRALIGEDRLQEAADAAERMARGEVTRLAHTKRLHKDGSSLDVSVTTSPQFDADGVLTGCSVITRDISPLLAGERERETLRRRLQRVEHVEQLAQIASGVAHDFNNYLATILLLARQALDYADDSAFVTERCEQILEATHHGSNLARSLFQLDNRAQTPPIHVDTNALVEATVSLIRVQLGDHIELQVDLATDLPPILADPAEIEAAIINLVVNAERAITAAGTITIQTEHAIVDTGSSDDVTTEVILSVSDDGTGMTSAVADHAFEAYFSTHLDNQGNGLGLAQVYRTAIKAGGTASINSVEGEGTAIQLRLPALVSDPEKAPDEMPTPEA